MSTSTYHAHILSLLNLEASVTPAHYSYSVSWVKVKGHTGIAIQSHITPPTPQYMTLCAHLVFINLGLQTPKITAVPNLNRSFWSLIWSFINSYLSLPQVTKQLTFAGAELEMQGYLCLVVVIQIWPESLQPSHHQHQKSRQHLQNPAVMWVSPKVQVRNVRKPWWHHISCGFLCWTGLELPFHVEISPAQRNILHQTDCKRTPLPLPI